MSQDEKNIWRWVVDASGGIGGEILQLGCYLTLVLQATKCSCLLGSTVVSVVHLRMYDGIILNPKYQVCSIEPNDSNESVISLGRV